LDQFNTLTTGPAEVIRTRIHELFETPVENIRAFAEAARECTY
jgi:hypothetical protein